MEASTTISSNSAIKKFKKRNLYYLRVTRNTVLPVVLHLFDKKNYTDINFQVLKILGGDCDQLLLQIPFLSYLLSLGDNFFTTCRSYWVCCKTSSAHMWLCPLWAMWKSVHPLILNSRRCFQVFHNYYILLITGSALGRERERERDGQHSGWGLWERG